MVVGWNFQDTKSGGKFDLIVVEWFHRSQYAAKTLELSSDKGVNIVDLQTSNPLLQIQRQFMMDLQGYVTGEEELQLAQIQINPKILKLMWPEIDIPVEINEHLNIERTLSKIFSDPLRRLTWMQGEKRIFDHERNNLDYWLNWCSRQKASVDKVNSMKICIFDLSKFGKYTPKAIFRQWLLLIVDCAWKGPFKNSENSNISFYLESVSPTESDKCSLVFVLIFNIEAGDESISVTLYEMSQATKLDEKLIDKDTN